ncbi:MAG: NAD(P)H-hydrate dehydratase [Chlorobi bacterium]|nr:NAD(P)H-hydrate dehydratase [Chlorobiota bacterium]
MIPLFSSEQIRSADNYAINKLGIPGIALMENASRSIALEMLSRFEDLSTLDSIGIICGKGNNGGDGFALARHLINYGFEVKIISLAAEKELKGDALANYIILKNLLKDVNQNQIIAYKNIRDISKLNVCSVVIDAMLGTGAVGDLREPYKSIVKKVNDFEALRVAVDIPTGINADTGAGINAFDADLTVTMAEFKKGLFFGDGYKFSGDVAKGDIGVSPEYFDRLEVSEYLIEPEDAYWGLPERDIDSHKYSAGKVLTIAGSERLPGAASLTAKATMAIGAGASILCFPYSVNNLVRQNLESVVVEAYEDNLKGFLTENAAEELSPNIEWADVVAIGPGLGREDETQKAVLSILKKHKTKKFVIDADAIFALRNGKYKNINLKNSVLTPHIHEFSDLIGVPAEEIKKDILKFGKEFVKETKSFLVLKGAPTIIFTPKGESLINTVGNPGMSKFGVGDVLTGVIAGLAAQNKEIENSTVAGVYLHSLSADLLFEEKTLIGFDAVDIIQTIPKAIKFLAGSID